MAEERTIVSFDYAIKHFLRNRADFVILSGFLSELLRRQVEVTAIIESEEDEDWATNRLNLTAQIDGGEQAIFDIQVLQPEDHYGKMTHGPGKTIAERISISDVCSIKKFYSINTAYYDLGAAREYLFWGDVDGFRGANFKDEVIPFAQTYGIVVPSDSKDYIHPEYCLILPEMFDDQLRDRFDEWVYVLKNSAIRGDFTAAGIKEAAAKLDYLNMPTGGRNHYERYCRNKSSLGCAVYTAEMNGEARGEAKGREAGKTESAVQIAKALKDSGVDVNIIVKSTGLSADEVSAL